MNDGDSLFIGLLCAGVVCVLIILIDGWIFRPKRDPGATSVEEPWLPKMAGYALVGLAVAMLWRLFRYEAVDFSLMLVVVGAIDRPETRTTLDRLSRGRLVIGERTGDTVAAPDTEGVSERWALAPLPAGRAEWKALRADREAQGFAGLVLPNGPRLLDLVRNPDVEDDRQDMKLAFG